jgi:hypothetical protein
MIDQIHKEVAMVVMVWKETLEQQLRREYNIPRSVKTEDIHSYMGKKMAEEIIRKVKLKRLVD